ncbi:DUF3068 domain-containing protein [Corynebacterium sp. AOP40-9SA-29]|uniref:DUF3068 domain-containing protein n=1 Tax=Corynebacterium sp. AOP40-9SA-29 TaxID=3457677 RepID=UPI00403456D5
MLPRSRVTAVLVLGLGCLLLVLGIALPVLVPPERPVPLELSESQLTLHDDEARVGTSYLGNGDEAVTAPVTKTYAVSLGEPADDDAAAATVGVTAVRDDMEGGDALLDAEVWSYRVDRMTGASLGDAKVADTPGTPAVASEVTGQWLAFPRNTEQEEYPVFDNLLRREVPAQFVQTEDVDGSEVYVFRQDFDAEPVRQANPGYYRSTSTTADGASSSLYRNGYKEYRVEPGSGMIVSVTEDIQDVYVPDAPTQDGEDATPELLSSFNGATPDAERDDLLRQAAELGEDRPTRGWGIVLTVTGAIVALGSAVVALRPQRAQRSGTSKSSE